MKKMIICLALLIAFSHWSHAQCDKKITWYASRMEKLDEKGEVAATKEGTISIGISAEKISMKVAERPDVALDGVMKEKTCEWKEAFKNGLSKITAELTDTKGNTKTDLITIEGIDGKINLLLHREGKVFRFPIDKYEVAE